MSKQVINLGASANDGTGDPARSAFTKTNANFSEIYQYLGDGSTLNKLGTAASKNTGTSYGNVMEVGAFGLGALIPPTFPDSFANQKNAGSGLYYTPNSTGLADGQMLYISRGYWLKGLHFPVGVSAPSLIAGTSSDSSFSIFPMLVKGVNATVDSNGFFKSASPVIKLFSEKIEPNDEALEQEPVFEKVDIGHYLLKNTEGFSNEGWYIEMPKDANANVLVSVQYQQLEDNTIEVKTFAKKFDEETGDILPNLDKPRDIPVDRWIDIRLKALPQPEIKISNTPPDFQPTNLAQAVAEALKNDTE